MLAHILQTIFGIIGAILLILLIFISLVGIFVDVLNDENTEN